MSDTLAVLCSALYAGSKTARAWLLEPIFDQVILPHQQSAERFALKELGADLFGGAQDAAPEAAPGPAPAEPTRDAVRSGLRESLPRILLGALLIVLVLPFAHVGQEVLSQWVLGRVLVDLQQQLCEKLLSLPHRYHHGQARGETMSRVTNDAQKAHQSLDLLFQDVVQSAVGLTVGAAVLVLISWQLTLTLLVIAPVVAGVIAAFGRRIRQTADSWWTPRTSPTW